MYLANKSVLLYIFAIVCKKLFRLFCYRIRELDTQLPLNWLCFIPWQSFRGREKNHRWDFWISHPCILVSDLHHKTHTGKALFSYSAPPLLASFAYKGCGVGEVSPAEQCLGHHTSSYLAEMLIMRMLHSALGEPLVVRITWKCTQEFRCLWTFDLNDPSTLGLLAQWAGFPQKLYYLWDFYLYPKPQIPPLLLYSNCLCWP